MFDFLRSTDPSDVWTVLAILFALMAVGFLAYAIVPLQQNHLRRSLLAHLQAYPPPAPQEPVVATAAPVPNSSRLASLGGVPFEALHTKEQQALRWWINGSAVDDAGLPIRYSPASALSSLNSMICFNPAVSVLMRSSTPPDLTFLEDCPHVWPGMRMWVRERWAPGIVRESLKPDPNRCEILFELSRPGTEDAENSVAFQVTITSNFFGITWLGHDLEADTGVCGKSHRFSHDPAEVWNGMSSAERRAVLNVVVYIYYVRVVPKHLEDMEKNSAREVAMLKLLSRLEKL